MRPIKDVIVSGIVEYDLFKVIENYLILSNYNGNILLFPYIPNYNSEYKLCIHIINGS
jgi:hypothetical protein